MSVYDTADLSAPTASASAAPPISRAAVNGALLALRIFVGVTFMAHGSQKVFGAFGGPGLAGVVGQMGPIGYLVSIGEFFGGLGILLGFLTRFSAAANIVIMLGAIALVHGKNGFFMDKKGFEYNWALIGLLLPLLIAGPGEFVISHFLPLPRRKDRPTRVIAPLE